MVRKKGNLKKYQIILFVFVVFLIAFFAFKFFESLSKKDVRLMALNNPCLGYCMLVPEEDWTIRRMS